MRPCGRIRTERSRLPRHHQVKLGFVPVCDHLEAEWLEQGLEFPATGEGFDEQVAGSAQFLDKTAAFRVTDDETPARFEGACHVGTGGRLIRDVAIHRVHEDDIDTSGFQGKPHDVALENPHQRIFRVHVREHLIGQITGKH